MRVTGQRVSFREVVKAVGFTYYPLALLGRLPFAMTVVGVTTMMVLTGKSLEEAGVASACIGIGSAIFGPLLGSLADRYGQRVVLLGSSWLNTLALLGLTAVVIGGASAIWSTVLAFCVGASSPQLSPMSRSRVVALVDQRFDPPRKTRGLTAAMSFESVADESVFILGPLTVSLVAVLLGAWSPLVVAAILTFVFVGGFGAHPTARATGRVRGGGVEAAPLRELRTQGIAVLVLGMFSVGMFFGSSLMALTAFADSLGQGTATGAVYAVMGIGSAFSALSVSYLPEKFALARRWIFYGTLAMLGAVLSLVTGNLWVMGAVLLLTGVGVGPTLVTMYTIGSQRSPLGRENMVMTMLNSSLIVGQSIANAVTGFVAQSYGHQAGYGVVLLATLVLVVSGIWNSSIKPLGDFTPNVRLRERR